MDRLNMAIALLQEAKKEKENLEIYNRDLKKIPGYGEPGHWEELDQLLKRFPRTPKKSVINDNIKITTADYNKIVSTFIRTYKLK